MPAESYRCGQAGAPRREAQALKGPMALGVRVMAATTTLVIALPKVGKTRMVTMVLGRIRAGTMYSLARRYRRRSL